MEYEDAKSNSDAIPEVSGSKEQTFGKLTDTLKSSSLKSKVFNNSGNAGGADIAGQTHQQGTNLKQMTKAAA